METYDPILGVGNEWVTLDSATFLFALVKRKKRCRKLPLSTAEEELQEVVCTITYDKVGRPITELPSLWSNVIINLESPCYFR